MDTTFRTKRRVDVRSEDFLDPRGRWSVTKWGEDRMKSSTERRRAYRAYIESDEWKSRREEHYQTHRYKCSVCGVSKKLQLHHVTYRNQGREKEGDLTWLCGKHHKEVHDVAKSRGVSLQSNTQLREVTNFVRQRYFRSQRKRRK